MVLVVDDDPGLQEVLSDILTFEGYDVTVARDGLEALDALDQVDPAVILLDLAMPRMDGYTFAEELARRGLRPRYPIIVLTADGRAQQKAERLQADGVLEKPFAIPSLLAEVSRVTPPSP
jgi:CheY-like chemotaxis protein